MRLDMGMAPYEKDFRAKNECGAEVSIEFDLHPSDFHIFNIFSLTGEKIIRKL